LFVISTDVTENIIYVGEGASHPGLFRQALLIQPNETHWVREDLKLQVGEKMSVLARIRYRQALQKAVLHQLAAGLIILFEEAQSAITAGQFAAWYIDNELIGSGVIAE